MHSDAIGDADRKLSLHVCQRKNGIRHWKYAIMSKYLSSEVHSEEHGMAIKTIFECKYYRSDQHLIGDECLN